MVITTSKPLLALLNISGSPLLTGSNFWTITLLTVSLEKQVWLFFFYILQYKRDNLCVVEVYFMPNPHLCNIKEDQLINDEYMMHIGLSIKGDQSLKIHK